MKFSAKTEYAVRALLELALNESGCPVQAREIAHRQQIPERFLEQVLAQLKRAQIVVSVRGAKGGYLLTKAPSSINMADIITAMEGSVELSACLWKQDQGESLLQGRCDHQNACAIRDVWSDVQAAVVDALKQATLEKICQNHLDRSRLLPLAEQEEVIKQ